MNNNYHTQLKPNMLNEIAANNQLLQQNYPGTPINKPNPPSQPDLSNALYQQQLLLAQQQQLAAQQNASRATYQQPPHRETDEIELSDNRVEKPFDKPPNQVLETVAKQVKQAHEHPAKPPEAPKRHPVQQVPHTYQPVKVVVAPKETNTTQYVVIPLALIIVFVVMIHPTSAYYIDKYLPSIKTTKGIFIRALILAVAYVLLKYFTSAKPPNQKN